MNRIDELLELISLKTNLSREEIRLRIKSKQSELSGLVSEEGAAYIVANELGVRTKNRVVESILKIRDIKPDMRSVNIQGRVKRIIGIREFTTKTGSKNKVANLELIDNSGIIRVVLWNAHDIEKLEKNTVQQGKIIQVKNGYVRENNFSKNIEVNVGNKGVLIENPVDVNEEEFPEIFERTSERSFISGLKENDYKELRGAIVNFFGDKFVHEMCPNCNKKVAMPGKCGKCGPVKSNKLLILNVSIDDGTGTIRAAMFRQTAEKLIGMHAEEAFIEPAKVPQALNGIIGREMVFEGVAKRNDFRDSIEFNIYNIRDLEPAKEAEKLLEISGK